MNRPLFRLFGLLLFLLCKPEPISGQIQGLHFDRVQHERVVIPFSYQNNFIIVDVVLNDILPLKFIFDTGAEYTILNKREIAEALGMRYEKTFKVLGSDRSSFLTAYLARHNKLGVHKLEALNADLLVLDEDYFRFEEFAGVDIHGILGANFFKHLLVQIDYKAKTLTFQYPEKKLPKSRLKDFRQIPIFIKKNKVYVHSHVQINPDTILQLSLLLDTGAGLTTVLHTQAHSSLSLPTHIVEGNLAMGLGGYLKGYLGRIHRLELGSYFFDNLLTNFQVPSEKQDSTSTIDRHGILGNLLLSRFDIIIDYPREKLYLRARKKYNQGFKYDRSGLGIIARGKNLKDYEIKYIVPNSPSDLAGLQVGDIITKVNFFNVSFLSLSDIIRTLQKKEGKRIRLHIRRNGRKMKFSFRLRDII